MHTHIRTCVHTYLHTYMHAYMHTYIHAYMHTYIHACMHTGRPTDRETGIHTRLCECVGFEAWIRVNIKNCRGGCVFSGFRFLGLNGVVLQASMVAKPWAKTSRGESWNDSGVCGSGRLATCLVAWPKGFGTNCQYAGVGSARVLDPGLCIGKLPRSASKVWPKQDKNETGTKGLPMWPGYKGRVVMLHIAQMAGCFRLLMLLLLLKIRSSSRRASTEACRKKENCVLCFLFFCSKRQHKRGDWSRNPWSGTMPEWSSGPTW